MWKKLKNKISHEIQELRDYKGKDGIQRNIGKLIDEYYLMQTAVKAHDKRWKEDKDSHAWVNLFVERNRISPYFMGHIDAVVYPVCFINSAILLLLVLSN